MFQEKPRSARRSSRFTPAALAALCALGALTALTGSLVRGQSGATPTPLENLLPSETMLFVSFPDMSKTREGFKKTALYKMYEEPEVKYAIDTLLGNFDQYIKQFEEQFKTETSVEFESALDILNGQVSLALLDADLEKGLPAAALAIDFGTHKAEIEKLALYLTGKLKEDKPGLAEEAFEREGVKVSSLGDEEVKLFWAFTDASLLAASRLEVMEGMLDRLAGKDLPSLGGTESFKKVRAEAAPEGAPSVFLFAKAGTILEAVRAQLAQGGDGAELDKSLEALGVRGIDSVGLALSFADDGMKDRIYLHAPGPREGLLKMLTPGVTAMPFLKDAPAESISFSAMRLDLGATWDRALDMLKKADQETHDEVMEKIREFEQKAEVKIREDLLASLGNEVGAWSAFPEGGGIMPSSVTAATLKDPVAFETSLQKLYAQAGLERKQMEWMGREFRYFVKKIANPEEQGPEPEGGFERQPDMLEGLMNMDPGTMMLLNLTAFSAYFVEGGTLYTSNLVQTLKDFLRARSAPKRTSLGDSQDFKALISTMPKDPGMVMYYDLKATFRLAYNTLLPILQMAEVFLRSSLNVPFETAVLPTAEALAKHMTPSMTAVADRPQGMMISSYSKTGISVASFAGVATAGVVAAVAIPGLLRSKIGANETSAMATLKMISLGQEQFKSLTAVDQDVDGLGEYGFLQELAGTSSCRSPGGLEGPNYASSPFIVSALGLVDPNGVAVRNGYYFKVFLPGTDAALAPGAMVPAGDAALADAQENRFCAYAWPVQYGKTGVRTFFINQDGMPYGCAGGYGGENAPEAAAAYDAEGANPANLDADPAGAAGKFGHDGNFWVPTG